MYGMNSQNGFYQCRLCLKRTTTKVNVLAGDFPKMLEILTSIKVKENDGLPKYSCFKCAQDVKSALITKRRIIKAHKLLVDSLRKKKAEMVDLTINSPISNKQASPRPSTSSGLKYSNSKKTSNLPKPIAFVNVDGDTEIQELTEKSNRKEISLTKVKSEDSRVSLPRVVTNKSTVDTIKIYKCEICNITFDTKSGYNTHSGKHKKTTCDICSITVRSDNFKKHLMLHTSGPATCKICGATYKNIESLRSHIFYQHKSSTNAYVCEECGKHFRIKYKFELHKKKEHTGIRNFKCETCGKAFFTKANLTTHVNMKHKKLRPHICEFCGTGFSSSYALKTHKRQHTNEKPFKCEFCPESFRQKVSLRSHLKSKHKVEEALEHFCEHCDRGFATSYALSIHARLHMAEKCNVCSETFAEKQYLINHLKDAHNVITESEEICNIITGNDEKSEKCMPEENQQEYMKLETVDIKPESLLL